MPNSNYFRMRYDLRMQAESETAEILVYGEICSYKWDDTDMTAMDFDKLLKDAKAGGAKKLRLRINSPGGAVYQAVAMRTMLMNAEFDEITVAIEGLCASAATLFVCLPNVHSTIAEGSEFMIHNPSTVEWGTAADFEKCAERLRKLEGDFQSIYAKKCGHDADEIKRLMDGEHWFTAKEAVAYGFCDELIESEEIAACVSPAQMRAMKHLYRHTPAAIRTTETAPQGLNHSSNTEPTVAIGDVTVDMQREDHENMEIRDITVEQLMAENRAVYDSAFNAGAAAERERMQDIDALTPTGYEAMAEEAKANGTSALEYHRAIIRAQKQRGTDFLARRRSETAPAAQVTGGAADAARDASAEDRAVRDVVEYAKAQRSERTGDMY